MSHEERFIPPRQKLDQLGVVKDYSAIPRLEYRSVFFFAVPGVAGVDVLFRNHKMYLLTSPPSWIHPIATRPSQIFLPCGNSRFLSSHSKK